jgi:hypothetical protein
MIFARYKGTGKEGFTVGRIYVAKPELDDDKMVGFGFLEVQDDAGSLVRVDPDKEQFEFVEEVYAVVTESIEDLERGEVVVVDDASEDREQLSVKGSGFWKAGKLAVLDGTNVFPGLVVKNEMTGKWVKVARVDEALWLMPEGEGSFHSPEEFRFAVSETEGELMLEPLVKCIFAFGKPLTEGKRYYLKETWQDGQVVVVNDVGNLGEYSPDRFRMG